MTKKVIEAAIPGWKHPAPLRTWKLSSRGPHQYWAGRLPGNVWCCFLFISFHYFRFYDGFSVHSDLFGDFACFKLFFPCEF